MLKRLLKGVVIGGISLVLLVAIAAVVLNIMSRQRLNRVYDVVVPDIPVAEDEPEVLARGQHLVTVVSDCTGCHASDLAGTLFFEEPSIGRVVSRNITPAAIGSYQNADYVRAIRYGLEPDGTPLLVMPSHHFQYFSDEDLGAVIAYLKSVPPVERELPEHRTTPLAHVLIALNQLQAIPAERIDHTVTHRSAPAEAATVEYGDYLLTVSPCSDCHGENLAGGQAGPGEPIGPNLTPGGELAGWTQDDFITLMRTGVHPSGRSINPVMPWQTFRNMTDVELEAIWLALQARPALAYEGP